MEMLLNRNQSGDHVTWQTVLQCLLNPETLNKNTFNLKYLGIRVYIRQQEGWQEITRKRRTTRGSILLNQCKKKEIN